MEHPQCPFCGGFLTSASSGLHRLDNESHHLLNSEPRLRLPLAYAGYSAKVCKTCGFTAFFESEEQPAHHALE
ncbi:MAG: hypothetical protein OXU21_01485 [Chloroflexota bacterium]|nr:hypothetical protein [Chloroflexota bacterium]